MPDDITEQVRKLLKPTSDESQWYAQLKAIDPARAIPVLAALLHDETETRIIRSRAALTLAEMRDERGIDPLTGAMETTDPVLRARIAQALGRFERLDEPVLRRLIGGLSDEDSFVRESCAKTLKKMRCSAALAQLEKMRTGDTVEANREVAREAVEVIKRKP